MFASRTSLFKPLPEPLAASKPLRPPSSTSQQPRHYPQPTTAAAEQFHAATT